MSEEKLEQHLTDIMQAHYLEIPGLTEELAKEMADISERFSAIIIAQPGAGKTYMLGTLPLPLLVFAFDPNTLVTLKSAYRKLVDTGWIFVLPFWKTEELKKPVNYKMFSGVFEKQLEERFFDKFASIAVDSFTTMSRSASYQTLSEQNKKRKLNGGSELVNLAQNDYNPLYASLFHKIYALQGRPVNTVLTAHLAPVYEDYMFNGQARERVVGYDIKAYRGLRNDIPALFPEKYVLTRTTDEYKLHLYPTSMFQASSGLAASGKLDKIENPNFRNLLKKADYPYKDKPHWKTGEDLDLNLLPDWLRGTV